MNLLVDAKKYFPQAYRIPPPVALDNASDCSSWMREMCAVPANESTLMFNGVAGWNTTLPGTTAAAANMTIAAFLVARGPHSVVGAPLQLVSAADWTDPFFRLYRLDTGKPKGPCVESTQHPGTFSREWDGGRATVDCTAAASGLDFRLLDQHALL